MQNWRAWGEEVVKEKAREEIRNWEKREKKKSKVKKMYCLNLDDIYLSSSSNYAVD